MKPWWRVAGLALVAGLLAATGAARAAPAPLVLGVIPQAPPMAMHEPWTRLVERLSEVTGLPVRLKLYEDSEDFERDFLAGGPDLLYAHPAMAMDAHRQQGYITLVRDARSVSAVIFVRQDSQVREARHLEGKVVAFVGRRNYCTILAEAALGAGQAAPHFERQLAGSSRNVLRSVVLGKADAGAVLDVSLEAEPAETRLLVRTLLTSPPTASHPFSAHPRVPADVRARIAAALLGMVEDEAGRAALAGVNLPHPVRADYERDYRPLERQL